MNVPEMVKPNHRYRGPMESRKFNNTSLDIHASLKLLRKIFDKQGKRIENIQTEVYESYLRTFPEERDRATTTINAVKGGEI